ncbi:hypothetical protein RESH_05260 [Rhodopirellula europaea SH398]|uniref:Uncharacterized protein n=1 Tax=Rhodopirellula europaea SH398 TaxID=1263868 RepID=M5SDC6_9BACT|nr:hypothetical protein RESH_05260 [Rhodopirellula europaea SH398]
MLMQTRGMIFACFSMFGRYEGSFSMPWETVKHWVFDKWTGRSVQHSEKLPK